jgi:hypothetical protein
MTTIRVPVHLVTVPTLVFVNNDHLVPGLEVKDFRVFDNGQRQNAALDTIDSPVTVAIAIQVNRDVREYVSFISKVGSAFETLLVGASGEAAIITYADEVSIRMILRKKSSGVITLAASLSASGSGGLRLLMRSR